jgi:HEAT repeat protein
LLIDDLDFFLLDIASEYPFSLDRFNRVELCYFLNRNVPPYSFEELKLALAEMFQRGDAVARIECRPGSSRIFVPTLDEIEAGLRGAFVLAYRLTPEGGARWESAVEADWSLYVSWSGSERYGWRETQSREYLEYILDIERAEGSIRGEIRWKELRPWRPLYWKTLPGGCQARYRTTDMGNRRESPQLAGIAPPPWGQEVTPRFHRGPKGLAPRRLRHPQPGNAEPQDFGPPQRKTELPHIIKDPRRMFAVACESARSADTEALLRMLNWSFAEARFASVRQLAERRESAAVPPLTALVLRKQYLPALWALGEIADERTLPVLELLLEYDAPGRMSPGGSWGGFLVRAIAGFGERALPMLEKMLASENVSAARGAVQVLGLIQTERSIAILEKERQLERVAKKRRIFWHIDEARRGDVASRPRRDWVGIRRLHYVAHLTGEAVDGLTPQSAIKALVATLSHPEPIRRRAAVDLLVEFGARDEIGAVEKLATDSAWQVRASVAFALRQLDGSRDLIGVLAADENLVVRWLAKNDILPDES